MLIDPIGLIHDLANELIALHTEKPQIRNFTVATTTAKLQGDLVPDTSVFARAKIEDGAVGDFAGLFVSDGTDGKHDTHVATQRQVQGLDFVRVKVGVGCA